MTPKKAPQRQKKERTEIPRSIAARVQFLSNRTCCVCRIPDKPIQIHHIDENPANHNEINLAVLCFDCHNKTMVRGGFGRKLDAEQVILYRDDWYRINKNSRASGDDSSDKDESIFDLTYITTIAEIYREDKNYEALAFHYNRIGNKELRDKYIEEAIKAGCDVETHVYLRTIQQKPELVPQPVLEECFEQLKDKKRVFSRARFNKRLGNHLEAISDYVHGISERLSENRYFTAAFYLKELSESQLVERLFEKALEDAENRNDLWWQVRALQELGRDDDVRELILKHEKAILNSDNNMLFRELLALAKGDRESWLEARKALARTGN